MYVSIKGWLSFSSDNIDSWIEKSYVFPFQDQRLAFIIEGHDFVIDGHGTGGIDGNGQAWYDWAEGVGNKHGRPIAMTLKGVRNGVVNGFQIIQPQFWAHLVWDSANIVYDKCYVNATNFNTKALTWAHSGLQNTDGINTYRSRNVAVSHFVYQGGDDCIALKPNSTEIALNDIRCHGGAGIAFGSIGQYAGTVGQECIAGLGADRPRRTSSEMWQCRISTCHPRRRTSSTMVYTLRAGSGSRLASRPTEEEAVRDGARTSPSHTFMSTTQSTLSR